MDEITIRHPQVMPFEMPPGASVNSHESKRGTESGFRDEDSIDYNLTYKQTGTDNDWRWQEQWLPPDAWYLLAVSSLTESSKPAH
jgi:hypothetical protein